MSRQRPKSHRRRSAALPAGPVWKIPSTHPAARDEGPRLIPLPEEEAEASPGAQRHLELADKLLGRARSPLRKPR